MTSRMHSGHSPSYNILSFQALVSVRESPGRISATVSTARGRVLHRTATARKERKIEGGQGRKMLGKKDKNSRGGKGISGPTGSGGAQGERAVETREDGGTDGTRKRREDRGAGGQSADMRLGGKATAAGAGAAKEGERQR